MIYNTIKHDIRNKANLSLLDYCLLESIYLLSTGDKCKYKTWCNAAKSSFEYLASSRTIVTRFNELEALGWMEFKDETRFLKRTTQKYYNEVYAYILGVKKLHGEETAPMKELHGGGEETAQEGVKKLHDPREETAPNNTIDNTIDNNTEKDKSLFLKNSEFEDLKKQNELLLLELEKLKKGKKHKEDKKEEFFYPSNFTKELIECFEEFLVMRKKIKKPLKAVQEKINTLSKQIVTFGLESVKIAMQASIDNQYQGIFPKLLPKSQKTETAKQDLEAYLLEFYKERDIKNAKENGDFGKWEKLLSDNLFRIKNISEGYKSQNVTPLFVFEFMYLKLGNNLSGMSADKRLESFKKLFDKQNEYNRKFGNFREIIEAYGKSQRH